MRVLYSPQFNDGEKINYEIKKDIVIAEINGETEEFDFTGMPDGMASALESDVFEFCPVISAERIDGILHLVLLNFIDFDSSEEERYPEWQEVLFDGED